MKRLAVSVLFVVFSLLVTACGTKEPYTKTAVLMDTVVTLQAEDGEREQAVDESLAYLKKIDALASQHEGSDLDALRQAAGSGAWVTVSPEVFEMLQLSKEWSEKTGGAFDVTLGPVIKLWGIGSDHAAVPDAAALAEARRLVGWQKLELDASTTSARLLEPGMRVHLGAIAKGYALDGLRAIFQKHGVKNGLVSLGGSSIYAIGKNPKGKPWRIGIRHPRSDDAQAYLAVAPLTDAALSSSGDYERYFEENGKRYHHIFDPPTGYPADTGACGVTVIVSGENEHAGVLTDILTTALFVMGEADGRAFLATSGIDASALWITQDAQDADTFHFCTATSGDAPEMQSFLTDVAQNVAWEAP